MSFFDRFRRLLPAPAAADPLARGTAALERDRLEEAQRAFAEALQAADSAAEVAAARNKRAIVAIRRGDRALAVDELVLALEADPRSPAAITTLGNLLLESGDVDEAVLHYEYAILIDDAYAPAYHNLGVALHRRGRRGEAVRMLRKATRLETRMKRP
ncbi:MAG TPA: tetratricopeptide repeat protein [Candidatus Baltobacteraceae bacterium]|nr:tetratricopeptide repeat protein [Candidatus Baltobacteraceae bacterium]